MKKFLSILLLMGSTQLLGRFEADMAALLRYVKNQTPQIEQKLLAETDQNKQKGLRQQLKLYRITRLIGEKNIEKLKKMDTSQLTFGEDSGDIFVPASELDDDMGGRLTTFGVGVTNALSLAVFFSAPEVLRVLLDKNLKLNTKSGSVYFIKNKPTDTDSRDYIVLFDSLEEAAALSKDEFRKALPALLKNR